MVTCPETATGKSQKSLWVTGLLTHLSPTVLNASMALQSQRCENYSEKDQRLPFTLTLRHFCIYNLLSSRVYSLTKICRVSEVHLFVLKLACYMKLYQCSKFGKKVTCQIIQGNTLFSTLLGPVAFCDRTRCKLGPVASSMFTTNF